MRLQPAGVDVLQADGAVVVRCVGNTFVGFASWEAEPTGVTVAELVTTSSPTDPTTLTVELALIHIIKKFADPTEIFPTKHSPTVRGGAQVRDSLPGRTHQAHHLIHRASVKSVIVGHILIMTKSAIVGLVTARPN